MPRLLTAVAVLAAVLATSACGSGHHTVFTKRSMVAGLAVPTPSGFHSRTWPGGVVISNRPGKILIPCTTMDGCASGIAAGYPSEDELVVYRTAFNEAPPALKFPLSLQSLQQASDQEWDGAGAIGHVYGAYGVAVWLGPKAPAADRSAILDALQNVKPHGRVPQPTAGAIREWRKAVFKPSHLNPWWLHHLGAHPSLYRCHPGPSYEGSYEGFYMCLVSGPAQPSNPFAAPTPPLAWLNRTDHPCGYQSHLETGHHDYAYNFTFCG